MPEPMIRSGISRKKRKKPRVGEKRISWDYIDPKGKVISKKETIERCNKLAIPPAWEEVWISPDPTAHLQATGMDSKGHIQYRYHANWILDRANEKFKGIIGFA